MKLIEVLEKSLGKIARKNLLPMQPGDVPATFADVDDLMHDTGFRRPHPSRPAWNVSSDGISPTIAPLRQIFNPVYVCRRHFLGSTVQGVNPSYVFSRNRLAINVNCDLNACGAHLRSGRMPDRLRPESAEIRTCGADRGTGTFQACLFECWFHVAGAYYIIRTNRRPRFRWEYQFIGNTRFA